MSTFAFWHVKENEKKKRKKEKKKKCIYFLTQTFISLPFHFGYPKFPINPIIFLPLWILKFQFGFVFYVECLSRYIVKIWSFLSRWLITFLRTFSGFSTIFDEFVKKNFFFPNTDQRFSLQFLAELETFFFKKNSSIWFLGWFFFFF